MDGFTPDLTIVLPPNDNISTYYTRALDTAKYVAWYLDPKDIITIYENLGQIWDLQQHYTVRLHRLEKLFEWLSYLRIQDEDKKEDFIEEVYILYINICKSYHVRPKFKYQISQYYLEDDPQIDYDWKKDPQKRKDRARLTSL